MFLGHFVPTTDTSIKPSNSDVLCFADPSPRAIDSSCRDCGTDVQRCVCLNVQLPKLWRTTFRKPTRVSHGRKDNSHGDIPVASSGRCLDSGTPDWTESSWAFSALSFFPPPGVGVLSAKAMAHQKFTRGETGYLRGICTETIDIVYPYAKDVAIR